MLNFHDDVIAAIERSEPETAIKAVEENSWRPIYDFVLAELDVKT